MTWHEWTPEPGALDSAANQTADATANTVLLEGAYGGSFEARATLNAYFELTPWTDVFALPNSVAVAGNAFPMDESGNAPTAETVVEAGTEAASIPGSEQNWLNDVQSYVFGNEPEPEALPPQPLPGADQGSALQRELPSEEIFHAPLPEAAPTGPRSVPQDSNAYHITQFTSAFNPHGPGRSNNCGPASLAMAMLAFGTIPEGINPNNRQQIVQAARMAMTGNTDPEDKTNDSEVEDGADKVGLRSEKVGGIDGIAYALDQGKLVVAGGNPIHYERALRLNGSNYGNEGKYDGGHFVLVVGRQGNDFIINDPMSRMGKLTVSRNLLEAYIRDGRGGGNSGVALWPKV